MNPDNPVVLRALSRTERSAPLPGDLVARCASGDQRAWRTLYETHADRAWRCAARLGVPAHELPDVLQESFVVVLRRLPDYDAERSSLSTWILGIVVHVTRNHRRREARARLKHLAFALLGLGPRELDPAREAEVAAGARELQSILSRMSPKLREALVLYELEELEGPELAAVLGCPEGTARSRLRLARAEFRALHAELDAKGGPR